MLLPYFVVFDCSVASVLLSRSPLLNNDTSTVHPLPIPMLVATELYSIAVHPKSNQHHMITLSPSHHLMLPINFTSQGVLNDLPRLTIIQLITIMPPAPPTPTPPPPAPSPILCFGDLDQSFSCWNIKVIIWFDKQRSLHVMNLTINWEKNLQECP